MKHKIKYRKNSVVAVFRLKETKNGHPGVRRMLCSIKDLHFFPTGRKRTEKQKDAFLKTKLEEATIKVLHESKKKRAAGLLLSNIFNEYAEERAPFLTRKSLIEYRNSFNHFKLAVGEISTKSFDPALLSKKLMTDLNRKGHKLPHKTFSHVNTFLLWAKKRGHPVEPLDKPKNKKRLPRVLTVEEIQEVEKIILKKENLIYTRAFYMLLYTGMRAGELINLKWENISTESRTIRIVDNAGEGFEVKGSHEEAVPMAKKLHTFLEAQDRGTDVYYLDKGDGERAYSRADKLTRPFSNFFKELGYKDVKPLHVFRYTFATRLSEKGFPVQQIQKLLRHKDLTTTMRYINSNVYNLLPIVDIL